MLFMLNNTSKVLSYQSFWNHVISIHRRCKHKQDHWSVIARKKSPKDRALEHYDDFYKTVFGSKWPAIRDALLSPHKYCAVVNNYSDTQEIIMDLEKQGAINMRAIFEVEQRRIKEETKIETRNKDIEKIYKLDKKMELLMLDKHRQELDSLYPANLDGSVDRFQPVEADAVDNVSPLELARRSRESLKSSLASAQYDDHRLIDTSSGLDASGLYEFIPATKLKGMEDWVPESEHYNYYKKDGDFPVIIKEEHDLHFPENLNIYTFESFNDSPFPSPKRGSTGVFGYYLLDGGSVLPVLALGLEPGDHVLDMCAAPGGKSLMMLQTLYPDRVVCNDVQESRTMRIHSVLGQFIYDLEKRRDQIQVTHRDGRVIDEKDVYNKILVDVPCTTDRHSVLENDNNIFKTTRTKERLKLPEIQAELLFSALQLVQPGGSVVYSTCSLSPVQNDGVVHMALRRIWEETSIKVEVRDLSVALEPTRFVFTLGKNIGLRYGHLVLPDISNNFGPLYFCKLVRVQ